MRRRLSRHVRFLLVVWLVLSPGLILIVPSIAFAQEPERRNCPNDFHWERMSGQCCVQDYATLPDHGKIGYTGNSLCEDGYVATYERRGTQNGLGVDGCPNYTSFVFLTSCASQAGGAADSSFAGDADLSDLTAAVYGGGSGPSAQDLATVGGLGTGILVLAGGTVVVLRRRPARLQDLQLRMPTSADAVQAWREWRAAEEAFEPLRNRKKSLDEERAKLIKWWGEAQRELWALEGRVGFSGRYTAAQIFGTLLALVSALLPGGWTAAAWVLRLGGGGMSLGGGLLKGDEQGLKAALSAGIARADGRIREIDGELERFKRVYDIGEERVRATKGRYESVRGYSGY